MRISVIACVIAAAGSASAPARADVTAQLQLTPAGEELAHQLGLTAHQLEQRIASQVDQLFATEHVDALLHAFADASAFSSRGLGVDYGSLPRGVMFGVSGSGALAASDALAGPDRLTRGLAADVAVMAGLDLARWGHPRIAVYANGFYQAAGTTDLDGSLASGGAHVQIKIVAPEEAHTAMRWIGIDLTTGLEVTRWTLASTHPIASDFTVSGKGQTVAVALASGGRFDLASTTATVPIELTTGIHVVQVFGLYVGGGVDITGGDATLEAAQQGAFSDAGGRKLGTVMVTGAARHDASPLEPRLLAGAQLALGQFEVFAQVNAAPSLASAGLGLRFVL